MVCAPTAGKQQTGSGPVGFREEVGAFARIYERIAIKTSPPRIIRIIPDFTRTNDSTH